MCALCMWVVEKGPRASMGRRGAHGDDLVGVFGAVSVAAVESLRGAAWRSGGTVGTVGVPT